MGNRRERYEGGEAKRSTGRETRLGDRPSARLMGKVENDQFAKSERGKNQGESRKVGDTGRKGCTCTRKQKGKGQK